MEDVTGPGAARRRLPLLITAAVGAVITVVVFFIFLGQEEARMRADFQNMSSDRAQAIRSAIAEDALELDLLASYVAASRENRRGELGPFVQEFGRLVRRIPIHEEDTQVLAFISALPADGRSSFEALMQKEVNASFAIRESGPGGTFRQAGNRAIYYPVTISEPVEYSGSILGLDVASIPRLREAIEHALASGKRTASGAVDLPLSASGPQVVWNFLPVYRSESAVGEPSARAGLLGICASAFRIDQMVELALNELSPAGIDLELLDANAPAGQQSLYYHKSRPPGYVAYGVVKTGMKWSTTINAGEHTWILIAYPTASFIFRHRTWQSWTILAGGLLLTGFSVIILWGRLRRAAQVEAVVADRTHELAVEISKHETLENALAESRSALTAQVVQLNQKNQQIQMLNEVGDSLQSCLASEEAYSTVSVHAPLLLPGTSGTLFVHDPVKDLFFPTAKWGEQPPANPAFKAEDCWALRRGKTHAVSQSSANLPCRHTAEGRADISLCIPLAAIGRTIGLLHVTGCVETAHTFAESVAEHIGLALSNLMLRSDLRQLSIHDPLTGLYNRRYMEETLETEIRRAERKELPIGVIMLDIDHFKAFNDGFGHAAGDQMLRSIGALLLSHLRAGDIACRFGGEEMLLILPEANEEAAVHRAEDIRARAKKLEVTHMETALGPVTVSLGVAVYPGNGRTRDELVAAADASLYKAKRDGRDRVVAAGAGVGGERAGLAALPNP
ncbi:MAG: diguanylate cyclase [Spirochaetia bacterium]|jgi:diguanylate cyclase (GGDEF)-like protein